MSLDNSRTVDEAGMDAIVNNTRVRASRVPIVVGATTFPASPQGVNWIDGAGTPISRSATTSTTLTAGELLSSVITLSCTNAVTATFDTAANIIAGMTLVSAGVNVGDYVSVLLVNGSSAANTITLAAGSGNSFDANQNNLTITQGGSKFVLIRVTTATTCTIFF